MRIKRIGFSRPAVVVLGAGATRGASFVSKLRGTLPPLDGDFFTQAQRLSQSKPEELVRALIQGTVELFGENFSLTMEGFLTQVEHLSHVFEDYKLPGKPAKNRYQELRSSFLQVLAAVLDEAIGRDRQCIYHRRLVRCLTTKDTVMSFNYDWLMDATLRIHGKDKWNPRVGYGVRAYKDANCKYWAYQSKGEPEFPDMSISLLKMHGSMNWFPVPRDKKNPKIRLRKRWWHQNGKLNFEIIPPEWNKPIRSGIYQGIWRTARRALRDSSALVFIGYSMPEADLPTRALFMVDAGRQHAAPDLKLLVVVNPDKEARRRIRRVLSARITPKTRIVTFDRFSEFSQFLISD